MKKVMEPKLVKEETSEKETTGTFTNVEAPRTRSAKANKEARCKTPDSPEGARQAPHSPSQSHPSNGPPSPVNGGSNDSITPPLPASTALSVNLDGVHPPHPPLGSLSNVTRPLVKVKRFLSTLVQFGNDIGADIGERVRSLVLNLVSSNLGIEEFHHSLQDVTNFPLRPFVLPFLRTHLPLLQREVNALARANKQSTLQYVRNHEHVVLDPAHSPSELSEIFMPNEANFSSLKRRASDSIYENGYGNHHPEDFHPIKRPMMTQNPFYFPQQTLILPNVHPTFPHSHLLEYPNHTLPNKIDDTNNRGDEEWKNIYVMLNCILSMVEKTKRALTILQQRNNQDVTYDWFRKQDVSVDLKKAANEIMIQAVKQTEDRVAEVKKRAEDAVNDVKRQAVIDLQKAVAVAEAKANELIAVEKAKMEKLISESRKTEENSTDVAENSTSPPILTQPAPSQQNACWNCGRKAHETCSGCGIARYCGSFCQHKDWENHHQVCTKEKRTSRATTPNAISTTNHITQLESPPKFKK